MRKIVGAVIAMILIVAIGWFAITTLAPEETLTPALDLEQNYSVTLSNATISLDYPATWALNAEFPDLGLRLATSEDLASVFQLEETLVDDEVYVNISFNQKSLLRGASLASILEALMELVEDPNGTVSDIETRTIDGREMAFVTLDSEDSSDGMTLVIDSGDVYSIIIAAFPDGDLLQHQSTIEAIAGSIEYFLIDDAPEMTPEATESSE